MGELEGLFEQAQSSERTQLANLVMTGGARPLHMCGMGRGGDTSEIIQILIRHGADVNAKDNYEYAPMDRLASNFVAGNAVLKSHGAVRDDNYQGACQHGTLTSLTTRGLARHWALMNDFSSINDECY